MPPCLTRFLPLAAVLGFSASARAFDSVVVINEINYHPAAGQVEWVELRNLHAVDVNLGRWELTGGADFVFPEGMTIPGHGYLVVSSVAGQPGGALGPFSGQLANSGERVRLRNQTGRIMDEVEYEDAGEWPVGADGSGATLARRHATASSEPSVWTASAEIGGTPGRVNFLEEAGQTSTSTLVAIGDVWKYQDSGAAAPEGWATRDFNDSGWKSGPTLISGGGGKLGQASPSLFPNGLLAYWAFDETGGTAADNAVAGQPDGVMANGAAFETDLARGQVAVFDGIDDRMEVLDGATSLPSTSFLPLLAASQDFTWAAWVWSATSANTGAAGGQTSSVILGNATDPAGVNSDPREYFKMMPNSGHFHAGNSTNLIDYPDLGVQQWTHMALVKRGLNLDFYRNGVFVQTRVLNGGMTLPQPFYVGGDRRTTSATSEHFQGKVDDVGLWTRALSAQEIQTLGAMDTSGPALPAPPVQTDNAVAGPEPRLFRKAFHYSGDPAQAVLHLWPVADDGAVIYLNGTEIWRSNVPATQETTVPAFPTSHVTVAPGVLAPGINVLAAEVHQFAGSHDLLFGAALSVVETPMLPQDGEEGLVFNEISAAGAESPFIELLNTGNTDLSLAGWTIQSSGGGSIALPAETIGSDRWHVITGEALTAAMGQGDRLFLTAPGGHVLRDAREITGSLRGRTAGLLEPARWDHPTAPTPGADNVFSRTDAVVINEIFYHGVDDSPEQWIELHNRSAAPVDLSGWRLSQGIDYVFGSGTQLAAGGFLVVAWDPAVFAVKHPGVTALGPWSGSLRGKGEIIRLRDANDNVADEVHYHDRGRWPEWADGGGSSLELIDPNADNSRPESWAASDESAFSTWETVSYTGRGSNIGNDLTNWHEFVMGLLDAGECLIDDISVVEDPGLAGERELIQNGNFSGGTADKWRIIGTHKTSQVIDDPTAAGNKVLHLRASAATEHMHNHACTTLKAGATFVTINAAKNYRISFRAKWVRGSPRLHTRLYFNRLAQQTVLPRPATGGTPGAANRSRVANAGPAFEELRHEPMVPAAAQAASVFIRVTDPDGVASVELMTSINGAAFTATPMHHSGGGRHSAAIPGQAASSLVQFYVKATDGQGAVSFFPAEGPDSRAMIPWNDSLAQPVLPSGKRPHHFRLVLPKADITDMYKLEEVMSNDYRPCTVIWNEKQAYYHARVRLKSSEHGRFQENRVGYNVKFGRDEPFLGAHLTISIDRSGNRGTGGIDGNTVNSTREILLKTVTNAAGGVHAIEDDIVRLIAPRTTNSAGIAYDGIEVTGAALISKSRFDDEYLDGIFEDGGSSAVFKYELLYPLSETINPVTRARDSSPQRENPKIPQAAGGVAGVAVTSLGTNKELYRWHWLIRNGRSDDNYGPLMAAVTAVGQSASSSAFRTQTQATLDVNTWLRACIPGTLFCAVDNYTADNSQHNMLLCFPPGQKGVLIPWDLDYLGQDAPTASLARGGDINKFITDPVNRRLYYGHMLDILNKSFNSTFINKWAAHYSQFGTDDMNTSVNFLLQRAAYARNVIYGIGQTAPVPPVDFALTTAGPLNVSTPSAAVSGRGWINVHEIRVGGTPLPVTWTNANSWTLELPVLFGTHEYQLTAYDPDGISVGAAAVTVTSSSQVALAGPGSLAISELNYNPPGDGDLEEFVELINVTSAPVDLAGCYFSDGIEYAFAPSSLVLPPGGRLLVVRDQAAFAAAYPGAGPVASGVYSGALNNAGEAVALSAANGVEIFRISYGDNVAGTDGGGRTLVRILGSAFAAPPGDEWRASMANGGTPGGTDALAFAGDPLADVDRDGLCALLEYAAGTSDAVFTPMDSVLRLVGGEGEALHAQLTLLPNADDAHVTVEFSETLGGWQPLAEPMTVALVRSGFVRLSVSRR